MLPKSWSLSSIAEMGRHLQERWVDWPSARSLTEIGIRHSNQPKWCRPGPRSSRCPSARSGEWWRTCWTSSAIQDFLNLVVLKLWKDWRDLILRPRAYLLNYSSFQRSSFLRMVSRLILWTSSLYTSVFQTGLFFTFLLVARNLDWKHKLRVCCIAVSRSLLFSVHYFMN